MSTHESFFWEEKTAEAGLNKPEDLELPMQDPFYMDNQEFLAMADVVKHQWLEELYGMDWHNPTTCYAIKILNAKYDAVSIYGLYPVVTHLVHLNPPTWLWWIRDTSIRPSTALEGT